MAVHLQRTIVARTKKPTASVIFLHGSGDTGQGIRAWIKDVLNQDLIFQHIRIIYPTAPLRSYTPMKQSMSNVWFDRYKISINCPEHLESVDSMCHVLGSFVDEEVNAGVAKDRIILGGFSMGGTMAMHLAYRFHQQVAGVFALSSFLNKDSIVYQTKLPPLFAMCQLGLEMTQRERLPCSTQTHCLYLEKWMTVRDGRNCRCWRIRDNKV
ncbi:lysophospholipase-like protein 1 isoform X2 [Stegostoma tigrinum]|uniref:lysophospholipase-like protein 1 isoform X2 n=1 Tax=Stegostoma tigrinum TaxID=3053191 RepID=UPI00286FC406|nr:lysophospholipase-like protein 1 isoform X2 [Stegostoma tigrinum]